MKQWPALLTGLIFGAGLAFSGMTDTAKVLGFLDITGNWDPDLAFVMGGALLVSLVATPWIIGRTKPLFAKTFTLPTNKAIDTRLIVGGMLFGIGWGIWGYCPGPAVTALAYGHTSTIVFFIAMVVGMWLAGKLDLIVSRLQA